MPSFDGLKHKPSKQRGDGMANRRMFSLDVIDTDTFLDMPSSARLLYFDLGMRADSNGFLKCPRAISRATGASLGDLELLMSKGYVHHSESGFFVRR